MNTVEGGNKNREGSSEIEREKGEKVEKRAKRLVTRKR